MAIGKSNRGTFFSRRFMSWFNKLFSNRELFYKLERDGVKITVEVAPEKMAEFARRYEISRKYIEGFTEIAIQLTEKTLGRSLSVEEKQMMVDTNRLIFENGPKAIFQELFVLIENMIKDPNVVYELALANFTTLTRRIDEKTRKMEESSMSYDQYLDWCMEGLKQFVDLFDQELKKTGNTVMPKDPGDFVN